MLETACLPTSIFGSLGLLFEKSWPSMLEPSGSFWAPRAVPGASKIQSFGSMCPRCFPRSSKVAPTRVPRRAQRSVLEGFSSFLVFLWCLYELLIVMPHCRCWHVVTLCFFCCCRRRDFAFTCDVPSNLLVRRSVRSTLNN